MSATPLVSVLMVTYNHERYIRQALDSVLAQKVPFRYEIVVGEDHSTDGTRKIVAEYAARHPEIVRALFREKNLGMHRNLVDCLRACRGRYVAWLDGDDYWLQDEKLARQVEMLDEHPECAGSFGRVRVFYEDGSCEPWEYPLTEKTHFALQDLLCENPIPSCTVVFRLALLLEIPEWFSTVPYFDWAMYLQLTQFGDMMLLPETLAAYRVHPHGVYSRLDRSGVTESNKTFFRIVARNLPERYAAMLRAKAMDLG